jgi:hypothetical protein
VELSRETVPAKPVSLLAVKVSLGLLLVTGHANVGGDGFRPRDGLLDDPLEFLQVFHAVAPLAARCSEGFEAPVLVPRSERARAAAEDLSREPT